MLVVKKFDYVTVTNVEALCWINCALFFQYIIQVKYKEEMKQATAIPDPPELKRAKENQMNISNVWWCFFKYWFLVYWMVVDDVGGEARHLYRWSLMIPLLEGRSWKVEIGFLPSFCWASMTPRVWIYLSKSMLLNACSVLVLGNSKMSENSQDL